MNDYDYKQVKNKEEFKHYLNKWKTLKVEKKYMEGIELTMTGQLTKQFRDLCENYKEKKYEKRISRNNK